jgi:hypothetical protein
MRSLITVLVLSAAAAPSLAAQASATIDPGMTREQVVAKLGQPLSAREKDGHLYLFYKNGCEKKCGMNDLVVLDSGKVVDAVFRSAARKYSGASSSPRMIGEAEARKGGNAGNLKTPPKTPEGSQ